MKLVNSPLPFSKMEEEVTVQCMGLKNCNSNCNCAAYCDARFGN